MVDSNNTRSVPLAPVPTEPVPDQGMGVDRTVTGPQALTTMEQVADPDSQVSDSLGQVLNAGLNRAMEKLGEVVARDIQLRALASGVASIDNVRTYLDHEDSETVTVCQPLNGDLDGQILLMLDTDTAIAMTRELLDEQAHLRELTDIEEEALQEIGNILINAFLTSYLKKFTATRVWTRLPTLMRGPFILLLESVVGDNPDSSVTFLSLQMTTSRNTHRALLVWTGLDCD